MDDYEKALHLLLEGGYQFSYFIDGALSSRRKLIFLRHDLDICPYAALEIAKIENRLGIHSSFFFQPDTETYTIFSRDVIQVIRQLQAMGHVVGLHINESMFEGNFDLLPELIALFMRLLNIDSIISFHKPSNAVLGRSIDNVRHTYDKVFFDTDCYVSDSARNTTWPEKMKRLLNEERQWMQILFHPLQWVEHSAQETVENTHKRRRKELDKYLKSNFSKVFGEFITI